MQTENDKPKRAAQVRAALPKREKKAAAKRKRTAAPQAAQNPKPAPQFEEWGTPGLI
ncbi:MAG TPA: hypothetical protein VIJ79_04440 [Acidobacteriaceae bacterium]